MFRNIFKIRHLYHDVFVSPEAHQKMVLHLRELLAVWGGPSQLPVS